MKRAWIILLLAALAACGADTHQRVPDAGHAPATVSVTLGAEDFRFEPANISLVAGQAVTVKVRNTGAQSHDFTIQAIPLDGAAASEETAGGHVHGADNAAVHVAVAPGATGEVEFTPAAAGTYEFDCSVPGHKEAGMVGQLTVKAP